MKYICSLAILTTIALHAADEATIQDGKARLQKAANITKELFDMLEDGAQYAYGENVNQKEHALQCATIARQARASEAIQIACLFHDIGHHHSFQQAQMGSFGGQHHEEVGAQFMDEKGFNEQVVALIKGHVDAKRYLVAKNPSYYEKLSEASKQTLMHQGGPMTDQETQTFEQQPYFEDILCLRSFDEEAKQPDMETVPRKELLNMVLVHLCKHMD